MTTSTKRYRNSLEDDRCISIERPEDFSMLGSASNPIFIDIEKASTRLPSPGDTDGDTIPETPSYCSQSHICHDQEDDKQIHLFRNDIVSVTSGGHMGHSMTRHGAIHEGVTGESPFSGETAAQPSTQDDCIPGVVSHATVAEFGAKHRYMILCCKWTNKLNHSGAYHREWWTGGVTW
ncbi:hypothetical protein BDV40DRAFT_300239 [Aspergillus tamarii]|uniref:Uncharacterized protein n=1 Tax=Aspergillus tamarii TaxID=41984 RepID=A0A5N6UVS5_ASPTM|nr:hypothetical protein BDV40DRAFT_300239 [Aspergillus tamarii]